MTRPTQQPTQKIHKNFVMINLPADEQKVLREMARETGVDLKTVLREALLKLKADLHERARLKRLTGWLFIDGPARN